MAFGGWSGEDVELVAPVQDARMGEVYAALFRPEGGRMVRVSADQVVSPGALVELVAGRRTLLCGEGERSYAGAFGGTNFQRARADRILASAGAVAVLASEVLARGETLTAAQVDAIYLREAIQARG
jgi:tRNA threonylcarbamoyladenosine biosynthesis protein TsaB